MNTLAWPIAIIDFEGTPLRRVREEYLLTVIDKAKRSYYQFSWPPFLKRLFGWPLCHRKEAEYGNDWEWEYRGTD